MSTDQPLDGGTTTDGSGSTLPDWLPGSDRVGEGAAALLEDPRGFIMGLIGLWVVNNVFIRPTLAVVDLLIGAGQLVADVLDLVRTQLVLAFRPAGVAVLDAIRSLQGVAVDAAAGAGIAAPVAVAVVNVTLLLLAMAVVSLAVRRYLPVGGIL